MYLQIPIRQKSWDVKYINSKPPLLCIKLINKSRILGFRPICMYIVKSIAFEEVNFKQYFELHAHDHKLYFMYQHFGKITLLSLFIKK
jgi:hypothetical protein